MNALIWFFVISIGVLMSVSACLLAYNYFKYFKEHVQPLPCGKRCLPKELGKLSSSIIPTIDNERLRSSGESIFAAVKSSQDARFAKSGIISIIRNLK